MGCGCGKKGGAPPPLMQQEQLLAPTEWGPILWKYLHCLAEKIGTSGNTVIDTDQANYMETLINTLPLIIPCTECQGHAAAYVAAHPLPTLKGLYGATLTIAVRTWLFEFHNAVRVQKGQPLLVLTVDECVLVYGICVVQKCEYTAFIQSVAAAVRQGWVRIENWKKWYSNSERLRILSGNLIV
jgi:hypothetical protein